jgi:hypothetical protein
MSARPFVQLVLLAIADRCADETTPLSRRTSSPLVLPCVSADPPRCLRAGDRAGADDHRHREATHMQTASFFPSKFLKAADLNNTPLIVTICGVTTDIIGQGAEARTKLIIQFCELPRGLVLNKTNFNVLVELTGSQDSDAWLGKRVQLVLTRVDFNGTRVQAIRIEPAPATSAPAGGGVGV